MDKEETILRLSDYQDALQKRKNLETEIDRLEMRIDASVDPENDYTFIRFFWPFLVFYPILFAILFVFMMIMIDPQTTAAMWWVEFLSLVIYFGSTVMVGKKRQKRSNELRYEEKLEWKKKEDEQLKLKLRNLQTELKKNKRIIDEIKDLLPSSCRNIESIKTILGKLTKGRAETIEEAMNLK